MRATPFICYLCLNPLALLNSDDGGETVHADVEELNEKMKMVAQKLSLKRTNAQAIQSRLDLISDLLSHRTAHLAGMGDAKKLLCMPTDIEGHRGKDGRFYVLDFARVFPPEHPNVAGSEPRAFMCVSLSLTVPYLICLSLSLSFVLFSQSLPVCSFVREC